jgi:hypothetical protein
MPRRKLARRFDPIRGVSMIAVEEEAKHLCREVENREMLSASDVDIRLSEVRGKSKQTWDHLCLLLNHASEKERRIIHSLLFRDFHHILELYLCHIRTKHPELSAPSPPPVKPKKSADGEFSEWLFDPPTPKGDSHASCNP